MLDCERHGLAFFCSVGNNLVCKLKGAIQKECTGCRFIMNDTKSLVGSEQETYRFSPGKCQSMNNHQEVNLGNDSEEAIH